MRFPAFGVVVALAAPALLALARPAEAQKMDPYLPVDSAGRPCTDSAQLMGVCRQRWAPGPPVERGGRGGLHIALGAGGGAADLTCDECDIGRQAGVSGFASATVGVRPDVHLGVEAAAWRRTGTGQASLIYSVMAVGRGYLSATSGLFFSYGVGLVGFRKTTSPRSITATAFGYTGRVGYEFGLGGRLVVVPYVGYVGSFGGAEFRQGGLSTGPDLTIRHLQAGLGLALH